MKKVVSFRGKQIITQQEKKEQKRGLKLLKKLQRLSLFLILVLGGGIGVFSLITSKGSGFSIFGLSTHKTKGQDVLASETEQLDVLDRIQFDVPAVFNDTVTMNKGLTVNGKAIFSGGVNLNNTDLDIGSGKLTASNVLYGLTAGNGITVTNSQIPTVTNTGVLSFQGQTGALTLSAGNGISISGTTITNSSQGGNAFGNISVGGTTLAASSINDTVTFSAGNGISLSGNSKTLTISQGTGGSGNFASIVDTGLTANGVIYANTSQTLTSLTPGTSGYVLQSNGTGSAPSWVSVTGGGINYWQLNSGVLSPVTISNDLAIGATATSSALFQVFGNTGNASTSGGLTFNSAGNIQTTKNQTLVIGGNTTGDMQFKPGNSSSSLYLASSGNVGVGTTNPSSFPLQVAGNTGPNATDTYNLGSASLEWNNLYVKNIISTGTSGQNGYWQRNASGGYNYLAPNTTADLLSIGQTTGLTATGLNVKVNALGNAAGYIENTGSGPLFTASASGNTRFNISNDGSINVGVGNVNTGSLTASTGIYLNGVQRISDAASSSYTAISPQAGILDLLDGTNNEIFRIYANDNVKYTNYQTTTTYSDISTINSTNPLTLQASGNLNSVAIGTVSPLASVGLDIEHNSKGNSALVVANTGGSGDIFTASSGATTKFVIDKSGNVGILTGTAGITNGLRVGDGSQLNSPRFVFSSDAPNGANGAATFVGNWNNSGAWGIGPATNSSTDNTLRLGNTAGSSSVWATQTMQLLIGGVLGQSALSTLDVRADSGTIAVASISGKTSFAGLVVDNSGVGDLFTASSSGLNRFVITQGGNVGIGVTKPTHTLQLTPPSGQTAGLSLSTSDGFGNGIFFGTGGLTDQAAIEYSVSDNNGLEFQTNGTGGSADRLFINQYGGIGAGITGANSSLIGNAEFTVNQPNSAGDIFTASQAGNTKFVISNAGNVGIGTTNPSSFPLQVAGNVGPNATDTYNLGSSTLEWNNLYAKNIITSAQSGQNGFWQLNSGALSPANISNDLLLGGTATSSATFGFLNIAGGTPTATISSNLSVKVPTGSTPSETVNILNGGSLNFQSSVGGDAGLNSNVYIANNGNVGIGTTSPNALLNINPASAATFSDNFNRADSANLGSNWTKRVDGGTDFQIVSNNLKLTSTDGASSMTVYTTNGITQADYSVQADIEYPTSSQSNWMGVIGRGAAYSTNDSNGYFAFANRANGLIYLYKRNNGSWSQLSSVSTTINTGTFYTIKLSMSGTTIQLYWNGVLQSTVIDSTFSASGYAGPTIGSPSETGYLWTNFKIYLNNTLLNVNSYSAFSAAGYLGIGTTSPAYALQVSGNINSIAQGPTNTTALTYYMRTNSTNQNATSNLNPGLSLYDINDSYGMDLGYNSTPARYRTRVFASGGGDVTLSTHASGVAPTSQSSFTDRFIIRGDSGKVGIGTNVTNPLATLDLQSVSGTVPIASISGKTSFAGLVVDNSGVGDILTASSSGLNRFVITQNGNVGIGTTAPTRLVDIVGNITHSSVGTASQLSLRGTADSTQKLNIGYDTTSNYGFIEAVQESVAWQNLVLQKDGGNIGIGGTDFSGFKLDMNGDIGPCGSCNDTWSLGSTTREWKNIIGKFGNFNAGLQVGTNSLTVGTGTTSIASISGATSFTGLVVDNSGKGDLFTASSSGLNRFVVTQNGNVGIGTTTPKNQLDINGSVAIGTYAGSNTATSNGLIVSGNIGIGTTNPTQALVVSGNEYVNNVASSANSQFYCLAGCGVQTFQSGGTSLFGRSDSITPLGILDARSGNYVTTRGTIPVATISGQTSFAALVVDNAGAGDLFTASSSGLNRFVITQNGNVGIGTTTPQAQLTAKYTSANTSAGSPLLVLDNPQSGGTAITSFDLQTNGTTQARLYTDGGGDTFLNGRGGTMYLNWNSITSTPGNIQMGGQTIMGTLTQSLTPLATLDVRTNSGTLPVASISGKTSFAGLVVDNSGVGDLFTASSSGLNRFVVTQNGNVGVGTTTPGDKLEIDNGGIKWGTSGQTFDWASGTTDNTIIWKLPGTSACANGSAKGIIFQNNSGTQVGHTCITSGGNLAYFANAFNASSTDLAENYSDKNNVLEPGDVVSLDATVNKGVEKTTFNGGNVIGIISTQPGFVLTDIVENGGKTDLIHPKPVALSGRVPTKVSTMNGPIAVGDMLTVSSIPGVAMKATKPGWVIGRALENYADSNPQVIGKIMVFVNLTWFDPRIQLTDMGTLSVNGQPLSTTSLTLTGTNQQLSTGILSPTSQQNAGTGNGIPQDTFTSLSSTVSQLQSEVASQASQVQKIDDLSKQLADVEKALDLTQTKQGSASAGFGTSLSSEDATIGGKFNVLGKTLLSDVGITGTLNMGLLTINGMDTQASNSATINTLSQPLKIQPLAINGVDFENGKVTIDTNGNIQTTGSVTAKKYNIDTSESASASVGEATIPEGQTQISVATSAVTETSKIFITSETKGSSVLYVTQKTAGKSFKVELDKPAVKDDLFQWWIVN